MNSAKDIKCRVLNGKEIAERISAEILQELAKLKGKISRAPGLGVILVGDNPASHVYVANKERYARKSGLETFDVRLPATASTAEVKAAVQEYNQNPNIDGILVQLPLPAHVSASEVILSIDPKKDADGLHPFNQGLLMRGEGVLKPCTPLGCMKLIETALGTKDLSGKNAVVLGRSVLVGKPVSLMLQAANATVTMAHSKTKNLEKVCAEADILVAAVGQPKLVKKNWVKEGAIVIDVGINRLADGSLCGDVDFEEVAQLCLAITPVPGGVGPMTIAMLILNTFNSFKMGTEDATK